MAPSPKVWLITGCSSGFGRELARVLLRRGEHVVVTARKPETLAEFSGEPNALVAPLDVTMPKQIARVIEQTEARFGRIDVLVNNAGFGYLAAVEEGEDDEVRAMFETNVFGLTTMIKAVLPGMRKRGSGCIVNISSMGGLVGFPGVGYYNATKFAVEGLSEALAKETAPLGIKVIIVEPGPFRTEWAGGSLKTPARSIEAYATTAGQRRANTQAISGKQPGDPVRAAEAIVTAVEADEPPLHLLLGRPAYDNVTGKLKEFSAEIEKWRELTLNADYPKEG